MSREPARNRQPSGVNEKVAATGAPASAAAASPSSPSTEGSAKSATKKKPAQVTTVIASTFSGEQVDLRYTPSRVIGKGSFGVVFQAQLIDTAEQVAIKKVLQDRRYKNRELEIMKLLRHENVVPLKYYFYSVGDKSEEVYLNLVLDFVSETVHSVTRTHFKASRSIPVFDIKLYMYQLCRGLAYLHSHGVCHRDIKPENILVDPRTGALKLCDLGSAKVLVDGGPSVGYICSRFYRAPELIFGCTEYTVSIDVWSVGCVMAELFLCRPIFPADTNVDLLVKIIKVLGTPTKEQIVAMNKDYTSFKFPTLPAQDLSKVIPNATPDGLALLSSLLIYEPNIRSNPFHALAHPFFDELFEPGAATSEGVPLSSSLFAFTPRETELFPSVVEQLTQRVRARS